LKNPKERPHYIFCPRQKNNPLHFQNQRYIGIVFVPERERETERQRQRDGEREKEREREKARATELKREIDRQNVSKS
jgi:hypothetical protein